MSPIQVLLRLKVAILMAFSVCFSTAALYLLSVILSTPFINLCFILIVVLSAYLIVSLFILFIPCLSLFTERIPMGQVVF